MHWKKWCTTGRVNGKRRLRWPALQRGGGRPMPDTLLPRLTVLIGVVALGLVIVPAIVYDAPAPWEKREAKKTDDSGELKVKIKGIELTWGRRSTTKPGAAADEALPAAPS